MQRTFVGRSAWAGPAAAFATRLGGTKVSAICYCPVYAVVPGDPFLPNEQGERGAKVTFQCTVETAAEFLNLSTRGPRCEARLTSHVRRGIGAEAFTVAGAKVPVALSFGHWGKTMILRRCQEAPGGLLFADLGEASSAGAQRVGP